MNGTHLQTTDFLPAKVWDSGLVGTEVILFQVTKVRTGVLVVRIDTYPGDVPRPLVLIVVGQKDLLEVKPKRQPIVYYILN